MSFQQERTFNASPAAIYRALTNAEHHSAFTGAPATSDCTVGGAWTAFGGAISGTYLELVEGQCIVQSWRPGNWEEAVLSTVTIRLQAVDGGTRLTLTHSGYPEGTGVHLEGGWDERYWGPLEAWIAATLA